MPLCVCVDENRKLVVREGAIPLVLAALKQHMANEGVARAACSALGNISGNGEYALGGVLVCASVCVYICLRVWKLVCS